MKARFLTAASAAAIVLCSAQAAMAQQAADAETPNVSDIVVTGSRISISGYKQPTPVTVVGEELLQRDAKVTIGDSIRELPSVGRSQSPGNGNGAGNVVGAISGLDTINLRNLGTSRTLVLFDGQRIVQSSITGVVDLGTVPSVLVERVDVVTAGASAAWGSDAVSGVVNMVLNKRFDGFRGSIEAGDTYAFDYRTYRVQGAYGTGFDDDRGRVIVALNYQDSPEVVYAKQRKWNKFTNLVNNPAYTADNNEPKYIHADGVGMSDATQGGLITGGPFKGIQFLGNGIPVPYTPGIGSGPVTAGGDTDTMQASLDNLAIRFDTLSAFGYASYELADWLRASVQVNYGKSHSENNSVPAIRPGSLRIALDNAFLPQSIKDAAAAYNLANPGREITNIPLGTTNINNLSIDDKYSPELFKTMLGIPMTYLKRTLKRGVFSLGGDLGGTWSWNSYYQYGKVDIWLTTNSNVKTPNYNLAIDAVVNPLTGAIVCRSTLTNPGNGCVPLNIFGVGVASPEAIKYVNAQNHENWQTQELTQQVVAASAQGTLPFGLPAGDIAVAFGAEYRTEKGVAENSPTTKQRIYSVGNFERMSGKYNVKEGFVEVDVPLLDQSVVDQLSFNAALRVTDYSTSGTVKTWKVGLTSQVNPDIRLRGTVSRDIRAPNLNELFSEGLSTLSSAIDPRTGTNQAIFSFSSGNPNLTPEKATTYSAGLVLTPGFAPGLSVSLDYYSITLKDAIATIGSGVVRDRCASGDTKFCDQLVYEGEPNPLTGLKALSQINVMPQNLAELKVSGLDLQADYRMPLGAGDLGLRAVGNYIFNQSQDQLGTLVKSTGSIGPDNGVSGTPRARLTTSATYTQGPVSMTLQSRFIGAAKLVYNWGPKDVDTNKVNARAYIDLRGSYQLTDNVQFFGTVDNLLNKAPPIIGASPLRGQSAYYFVSSQAAGYYDVIGRIYRIGARLKF